MFRKISLFLSFLNCLAVFSQENIANFPAKDKDKKDIFTIVNNVEKETSVFFFDKKNITASRYDARFKMIDTLSIQLEKKQVDHIVGYSRFKNQYYIYWEGANSKEIVSQRFDFDSKQSNSTIIPFEIDKEKIIDKFTANNIFYIVTAVKNTSILHFYRFDSGKMDKNTIDCSAMKFLDRSQKLISLWDLYRENSMFVYYNLIENISSDTPASLVLSANKKKAYINDDKVTFTFDVNRSFTQALTVDLTNFTALQKAYPMPFLPVREMSIPESNSLLINDRLIQLKVSDGVLILEIKDLDNNVLKNIFLNSDQEVSFKNSDIIQESGSIESTRILGNSNQLIRKINNLFSSVSGYYIDDKYYLVIGGVSPPQQNGAMIGGMIGGFTGAMIGSALSSNYSVNNLNSYNNRKVVYIQSIFDKDFNHIEGETKKLAFDKLRLFVEKNDQLTNQTVFKLGSNLYLLALNKKNKEYLFYKFEE